MNKSSKTYRLSENSLSYLEKVAKEFGLTNTAALEKIIRDHESMYRDQGKQIATQVVNQIEEKYANMFTRIRLATTMSDRNIEIILELLNTIIISQKITTAYTSEMAKSFVWQECEEVVKERIARYKQKRDNNPNK